MKSGCRWVYTLMDWDTGEVVAKGTSVELVEQGYFSDVNKLSSVWNNLEKCKNPSPKNYRWKMERKSTKDDRVERARAEGLSADERAETRMVRVYSCYGADGTLLGKGTAAELKDKGLFGSEGTQCTSATASGAACTSPAALRGWRWSCARNGSGTP